MSFTENQQKAMNITTDKNILVSASAGAGKTTVMVERIRKLVSQKKVSVDKLIVVTFTRLAAGEIKEKLFELFSETDDDFVAQNREKIDAAAIGTIHSFCADVVRKYFYLAEVDPNFSVMEDDQAKKLFFDAVEDVFATHYQQDADFIELLDMFGKNRNDENLKKTIRRIYQFSLCVEDLNEWYTKTKENAQKTQISDLINGFLVKKCHRFRDAIEKTANAFVRIEAGATADYLFGVANEIMLSDKAPLETNLRFLCDFKVKTFANSYKQADTLACQSEEFENMLRSAEELISAFRKWLADTKKQADVLVGDNDQKTQKWVDLLVALTIETDKRFSLLKKESNGVDFGDLERLTLKILSDDKTREEIKDSYEYVFVDEYQDTNGIQEAILEQIVKKDRLFVVGDVKQSIYGFRQSDPDIFVSRRKRYIERGVDEVVDMNDNFRCNKSIADFVNFLFENLMTEDFGQINYAKDGKLICKNEFCVEDGDKAVVVAQILADANKNEDGEVLRAEGVYDPSKANGFGFDAAAAEGQYIADEIKKIVSKNDETGKRISFSDIVVLMRSVKSDALAINRQLLKNGIPCTVLIQQGSYGKEVSDLLSFLRLLDNPLDDFACVQSLVAPFCGLNFDELASLCEKAERICAKKGAEFKKLSLFNKLEIYATEFSDQTAKKLSAFFVLLKKYRVLIAVNSADKVLAALTEEVLYEKYVLGLPSGELRRNKLSEFLNKIVGKSAKQVLDESLFHTEDAGAALAQEDAVRIMTVHAAKGLEFGVVFLAGLNRSIVTTSGQNNVFLNKELGIAIPFFDSDKKTTQSTSKTLLIGEINKFKTMEEEMRLLYVGVTRAKRKLYLLSRGKRSLPNFFPEEASSVFQWVQNVFSNLTSAENPDRLKDKMRAETLFMSQMQQRALVEEEKVAEKSQTFVQADQTEADGFAATDTAENPEKIRAESDGILETGVEQDERVLQMFNWTYPFAEQAALPLKVASSSLDRATDNQKIEEPDDEQNREAYVYLALPDDVEKSDLGKAYHKIFEICDLIVPNVQESIKTAIQKGWIEEKVAQSVEPDRIEKCLANREFLQLIKGGKLYRELPFMTKLPYCELFQEGSPTEILLQGVIDLLIVKKDKAIVVDFKVTQKTTELLSRYKKQLNSYRAAAEKILKLPAEAYLFSVLDNKLTKV